jgi:hypothetical protein
MGTMANWLSREGLQPSSREFDSHRPLHTLKPRQRLQSDDRAVITTAEAAVTRNPIIGFLAVDLKEIHSDLPQLQNRMPEVR